MPEKPNSALRVAALIALGVAGWYLGALMVVPMLGMLVGYLIISNLGRSPSPPFGGAFTVQTGQLLWFITGLLAAPSGLKLVAPDIIILGVLLPILWAWPGRVVALLLAAYQLFGLYHNTPLLFAAEPGREAFKAVLVHIVLRAAALAQLWRGARALQNLATESEDAGESEPETPAPEEGEAPVAS